jgi:hypothetical protein
MPRVAASRTQDLHAVPIDRVVEIRDVPQATVLRPNAVTPAGPNSEPPQP